MNDQSTPAASANQFALLAQRRFLPFFLTQLAGAFTDNLFKQVLVLLATFHAAKYSQLEPGLVVGLAGALFIAPFVFFSAVAGQLADRYDKAVLIRIIKAAEVGIMAAAAWGFAHQDMRWLLGCVFAMGVHSAFFGPVKYSILPRVLDPRELTGGNALLETGTFVSILGGTLAAGFLVATDVDVSLVTAVLLGLSCAGLLASLFIPRTGSAAPGLTVDWNVLKQTVQAVRLGKQEGIGVWRSLLGISWFWFFGAVVLTQVPAIGKDVLHGDSSVVSLLLAVFSIGVAIGSLGCEKLSGHKVEIGLVPLGSIGLTVAGFDLAWTLGHFKHAADVAVAQVHTWQTFLAAPSALRVLADIGLLGLSGGLFIVPLYAFVQLRTAPERQSRIISANNILNAVFMVGAAGLCMGAAALGASVTDTLLACVVLNAIVAVVIYRTVPEFLWRFVSWVLVHAVYRVRLQGTENIPQTGPALIAPNHVTYADALILSAASPRPIRFVMDAGIFKVPVLSWFFRQVRAIPVASAKEDPKALEHAMQAVADALAQGELVCVFPEGRLTRDGNFSEFRPGILRMQAATPVPLIPVGLSGLWGSVFCRDGKSPAQKLKAVRLGRKVQVAVGPAMPAPVSLEELRAAVSTLRTHP